MFNGNLPGPIAAFPIFQWLRPAETGATSYTKRTLYWPNLNIIAQEGCFLLYNHKEDRPLEEYMDGNRCSKSWCLNIHKSLGDYVRMRYLPDGTK